jgi:hypothetical protein
MFAKEKKKRRERERKAETLLQPSTIVRNKEHLCGYFFFAYLQFDMC